MQLKRGDYFLGRGILVLLLNMTPVAPLAIAQRRTPPDVASFRADCKLVLVPVMVLDRRGATVNGLASGAFTLTENGVRQQIRSFGQDDGPVSLGIVLDLSGSMKSVLTSAKESFRALMEEANPEDEAFLRTVSTRPGPSSGFIQNFGELVNSIAFEKASGATALIDTVYDSLREIRSGVHPRKALLVISDGVDNNSRHSRQELMRFAEEADTQVYAVAVSGAAPYAKAIERTEEARGLVLLDDLADRTGGLRVTVRDAADVEHAVARIGRALRNQYTLGYLPEGDGGGRWRKIRVTVAGSGMKAYSRGGYRVD